MVGIVRTDRRCIYCDQPVTLVILEDDSRVRLEPEARKALVWPDGQDVLEVRVVHVCDIRRP